ncbi:hypothetical protein L210DRAFT_3536883 [Boletus edulis BED1]|uniref:G domain-containing protein n=1 Tax=Boletus edulis BED1 TaxID=1328754 RepID=A0AAD4GFN5_BOLED|nr:hypothetical protein L210DRAFT_3536883 [Boletus edulis BED1]
MIHNLTQLLAGLWNKFKQGSSIPAPSISKNDIVVFVAGPTGSGKSWFIKEATRAESVKSSRGYHPSTTKVQAIRCELTDEAKADPQNGGVESIVFVDTPSFLTACDDIDAQKEITTWIDQIGHKPRYLGIIYMHRIETDPAIEPIGDHLQELATIPRFGDRYQPLRLHVVVSCDRTSGSISDSKIKKHEDSLRTRMLSLSKSRWQPSMHQDHFQGEPEVAWKAVEELIKSNRTERGSL